MISYAMEEHQNSLLPEGYNWKLVWHDEFDGTELDRSKWGYRLHLMQKRHQTYTDQGAMLDGKSNLLMPLIQKDGQFFSSQLQTGENFMDRPVEGTDGSYSEELSWPIARLEEPRFLHTYGYYEIRCKLQEQPGWWSAFWLQSPIIGSSLDPEISGVELDIMENFTRDGRISHNHHWNGYGAQHQSVGSGNIQTEETPDGFHRFGLHWRPDGYTYYVDGRKTWHVDGPVSRTPQFILISTECCGYRDGNRPREDLAAVTEPDAFIVDYVRVFDEI
ncbi:MAG: glycoside hydrolase family 16 protein [Candidatus Merdivicinus sp.]